MCKFAFATYISSWAFGGFCFCLTNMASFFQLTCLSDVRICQHFIHSLILWFLKHQILCFRDERVNQWYYMLLANLSKAAHTVPNDIMINDSRVWIMLWHNWCHWCIFRVLSLVKNVESWHRNILLLNSWVTSWYILCIIQLRNVLVNNSNFWICDDE